MSSDDRLIARLLAGGDRLSRVEKDEIFDRVAAEAVPRRLRWLWLAVPVLGASLLLLFLVPWHATAPKDELTARGNARPFAALRVTCPDACTSGSKLVFDLHGTTEYRYFAAFAKRSDGTVLWYFPVADDATSVDLAMARVGGVLDQGIVLGAEHPAGKFLVYGVFSYTPLTRVAIRDAFDAEHLTAGPQTAVVATELEVLP